VLPKRGSRRCDRRAAIALSERKEWLNIFITRYVRWFLDFEAMTCLRTEGEKYFPPLSTPILGGV
jgi:hypothetical protein